MLKIVPTTPYTDQKMGTAGLRRKSKVVIQPNYIENFLQSIFNTIGDLSGHTYVVGGDGRFYNDIAIQKFIKMAAANGVSKLIIQLSLPCDEVGNHLISEEQLRESGVNPYEKYSAMSNPSDDEVDAAFAALSGLKALDTETFTVTVTTTSK